jgi:hypothetical protein
MRIGLRRFGFFLLAATFCLGLAKLTLADGPADAPPAVPAAPSPILTDRPDAQTAAPHDAGSAVPFEDPAAGIGFIPPVGMKEILGAPGDVIVRYVDDDRHWVLTVSRMTFDRPVRLLNPAATHPVNSLLKTSKGILDLSADQLKLDAPGAEIFREDVITAGSMDVGMLAARYTLGVQTSLTQQAYFRMDDENFYLFNLTVPAPRKGELGDDPSIQSAVSTFTNMLDTVHLLEQTSVREEQEDRLMHTRTLFVNWTPEKIKSALIKEQWLRIVRDGHDVGYCYVVEDVGRDLPRPGHPESEFAGGQDGALIGMRSRTVPKPGIQVDSESWLWVSFDRKHEKWSNNTYVNKGKDMNGKPQIDRSGDVGSSDAEEETVFDKDLVGHPEQIGPNPDDVDKEQPPYRRVEVEILNAESFGNNQPGQPFIQKLPVFYIDQALAHLLPRLVPRNEPNKYMFASYVPEKRAVMARYVDVGIEQEVTIGGRPVMAVPVRDRIGLEGSITTHYIGASGQYLGSSSPDTKIEILPTDAATLQHIWSNADLSRPSAVPDVPLPTAPVPNEPLPGAPVPDVASH